MDTVIGLPWSGTHYHGIKIESSMVKWDWFNPPVCKSLANAFFARYNPHVFEFLAEFSEKTR
jgi:hypothetical protein